MMVVLFVIQNWSGFIVVIFFAANIFKVPARRTPISILFTHQEADTGLDEFHATIILGEMPPLIWSVSLHPPGAVQLVGSCLGCVIVNLAGRSLPVLALLWPFPILPQALPPHLLHRSLRPQHGSHGHCKASPVLCLLWTVTTLLYCTSLVLYLSYPVPLMQYTSPVLYFLWTVRTQLFCTSLLLYLLHCPSHVLYLFYYEPRMDCKDSP